MEDEARPSFEEQRGSITRGCWSNRSRLHVRGPSPLYLQIYLSQNYAGSRMHSSSSPLNPSDGTRAFVPTSCYPRLAHIWLVRVSLADSQEFAPSTGSASSSHLFLSLFSSPFDFFPLTFGQKFIINVFSEIFPPFPSAFLSNLLHFAGKDRSIISQSSSEIKTDESVRRTIIRGFSRRTERSFSFEGNPPRGWRRSPSIYLRPSLRAASRLKRPLRVDRSSDRSAARNNEYYREMPAIPLVL